MGFNINIYLPYSHLSHLGYILMLIREFYIPFNFHITKLLKNKYIHKYSTSRVLQVSNF